MNSDLYLVIGLILGVFAIPSIVSSFSDRRAPRVAAFVLVAAGCLVIYAIQKKPGGYAIKDIPAAFVRVVGAFL